MEMVLEICMKIFQGHKAGMIYNVFIILISNAVVPLFATYFDVSIVPQFIKKIKVIQEGENCNNTQFEANQ